MLKNRDSIIIWSICFFAAIIFASWYFLPIFFGIQLESLFVSSSSSFFQSIQSWQPLVNSVSEGNFFPASPNINDAKDFYFYPYFTLWFWGILAKVFSECVFIFLNQAVIPTACLFLMIKIFHCYVNVRWSISLSLLSLMSFSAVPFHRFLVGIISGQKLTEIATLQPLEILHFPFPSFSLFVFLLLYFLCTKKVKLTITRITIFTILWSSSTQIHPVDALFGLIFWFTYFPIKLFRQEKFIRFYDLILQILPQILIVLITISPILFFAKNNIFGLIITKNYYTVGLYHYFFYFLIPIFGCVLIYIIFRIDAYEIFLKFWHIYVLMAVELFLINILKFFDFGFGVDMIKNRIPLFFLHFYYYVPIVYFATRSTYQDFHRGVESKKIPILIRKFAIWFFNNFSKFYLPLFSILLVIFAASSSYKNFNYYKSLKGISEVKIADFKKLEQQLLDKKDQTIAFSDPVMISLASAKAYKTLWSNRFSNNVSENEIISRVALQAKIFGWTPDEFIGFMSRGKLQQSADQMLNLSENIKNSGIGYWLVFHKKILSPNDEEKYKEKLKIFYDEESLQTLIKKHNLSYIVTVKELNIKGVKLVEIFSTNELRIFKIYE